MFDQVSHENYQVLRPFFTAIYLLWATLWMMVAWNYGTAAYASWIHCGGRWKYVIYDMLHPFWWAIRETLCQWKFFKSAKFCGAIVPSPYESGHLLRFSIFLGSLTPISFGFQFAELDRSHWDYTQLMLTFTFASLSILAAGGHLFLAFRAHPDSWRKLVIRSSLWLLLAPLVLYIYYAATGWHLLPWAGM